MRETYPYVPLSSSCCVQRQSWLPLIWLASVANHASIYAFAVTYRIGALSITIYDPKVYLQYFGEPTIGPMRTPSSRLATTVLHGKGWLSKCQLRGSRTLYLSCVLVRRKSGTFILVTTSIFTFVQSPSTISSCNHVQILVHTIH